MLLVPTAVDVYLVMSVTGKVIAMVSFKTQDILVFLAYSDGSRTWAKGWAVGEGGRGLFALSTFLPSVIFFFFYPK